MKWFKHMTQAHVDDKLVAVRAEFGLWGYGGYWLIVEMAAEQMKDTAPDACLTRTVADLSTLFGCKSNKLLIFLERLENIQAISHERSGNVLKIKVPKLLQINANALRIAVPEGEGEREGEQNRTSTIAAPSPVRKSGKETRSLIQYRDRLLVVPPEIREDLHAEFGRELVSRELGKMEAWLKVNKPKKDFNRFVWNWLTKAKADSPHIPQSTRETVTVETKEDYFGFQSYLTRMQFPAVIQTSEDRERPLWRFIGKDMQQNYKKFLSERRHSA